METGDLVKTFGTKFEPFFKKAWSLLRSQGLGKWQVYSTIESVKAMEQELDEVPTSDLLKVQSNGSQHLPLGRARPWVWPSISESVL